MKTIIKIIFLIFLVYLISTCQKKKKDFENKNNVTLVLENLKNLNLKDIEKEKKLDSLSSFLLKQENDSIIRNAIFSLANEYYFINRLDKYINLIDKTHKLSIIANDTSQIAKSLCYMANYYEAEEKYDSAFSYYNKSEKLYESVNDTLMLGWIAMLKAGLLFNKGILTESEIENIKALQLLTKTNRKDLIFNCYNRLGLSLKGLNNFEKSLEYFNLALKQLNELEKENKSLEYLIVNRANTYNNIGWLYESQKKIPEAIKFYNKGLKLKDLKVVDLNSYTMLLDNLAHATMQTGKLTEAHDLLLKSLKISDSLDFKALFASSKINMGEYYLLKKDTLKGLASIREGYNLSNKIKYSELTLQALKLLSKNDTENESYYANLYIKLNDSLQNVERSTRNKFARIAYETDQIEEKNTVLSKWNTNIIIGGGISIFILGGLFIIYRLNSKNKQLLLIKDQQEANEQIYQLLLQQQSQNEATRNEERNRIAMELHDGIVNSIFTTRFNLIQLEPNQTDKKERLVKELENAENEIRRVSHDLQQNLIFEDKNLPVLLENLVKAQHNENNTFFDVSIDKFIDWSTISDSNKIHVYRIIQEGLQNINKYANAEKAIVFILKTANKTTIRIWDNGIGFSPEKIKHGIGLKNIKQRTKALNGELKITSNINKGTTIEIIF